MRLRVGRAGDEAWGRDVFGAVNIGLKHIQMGGFVASAPTGAHAARATLAIPHLGPTPAGGNIRNYRQMPLVGKRAARCAWLASTRGL
jgi:hypothetical protein